MSMDYFFLSFTKQVGLGYCKGDTNIMHSESESNVESMEGYLGYLVAMVIHDM